MLDFFGARDAINEIKVANDCISKWQMDWLTNKGIEVNAKWTKQEASAIIGAMG